MELYDYEIAAFLRNTIPKTFLKVLSYDEINPREKIPNFPAAVVFNFRPRTIKNGHWCCAFFFNTEECFFFDSFAHEPFGAIRRYLDRNASKIYFNKKQIQNFDSVFCGHHVCYVLSKLGRYTSIETILSSYTFNLTKNDSMVMNFYSSKKPSHKISKN